MAQHFAKRDGFKCVWTNSASDAGVIPHLYFFFPEAKLGCHPAVFWLGAAAMVLICCFLGFLTSRLPFCSPLAMSLSLRCSTLTDANVVLTVRLDQPCGTVRRLVPDSHALVAAVAAHPGHWRSYLACSLKVLARFVPPR
jgi:hypothetical protein